MSTAPLRPAATPEVTLSDLGEHVGEALSLIHDGFVDAGYMRPVASGRRLHPSYLNPGGFFAMARIGGETVGAMATVADGPFGLPSERAFAEEIDQLRAASDAPIYEAGSRVVHRDWSHRAGRISMFMIGSIINVGLTEFYDSPMLITVAPEAERSLRLTFNCERIADARPLFGAPAVLLVTTGAMIEECLSRPLTSAQRMMATLALDPDPGWIADRRAGAPMDADWLPALLDEQGLTTRLAAQLELLGERHPALFGRILDAASARIAA